MLQPTLFFFVRATFTSFNIKWCIHFSNEIIGKYKLVSYIFIPYVIINLINNFILQISTLSEDVITLIQVLNSF